MDKPEKEKVVRGYISNIKRNNVGEYFINLIKENITPPFIPGYKISVKTILTAFKVLKEKYPEITEEELFCLNNPDNDNQLYFESKVENINYEAELSIYLKFLQDEQKEIIEFLKEKEEKNE